MRQSANNGVPHRGHHHDKKEQTQARLSQEDHNSVQTSIFPFAYAIYNGTYVCNIGLSMNDKLWYVATFGQDVLKNKAFQRK